MDAFDIMDFIMEKTFLERWQKNGGDEDVVNEERYGKVPAESTLTLVDLMAELGMDENNCNALRRMMYPVAQRPRMLEMKPGVDRMLV